MLPVEETKREPRPRRRAIWRRRRAGARPRAARHRAAAGRGGRSAAIVYGDAARLGTYNPLVYRNLALADRNLGRWSDARAAAQKAVEMDRFDPANRALLAQFEVRP